MVFAPQKLINNHKKCDDNMVKNVIQLDDVRVKDLSPFKRAIPIEFVNKTTDMSEIEGVFEKYHVKNQKLETVIIAETGQ